MCASNNQETVGLVDAAFSRVWRCCGCEEGWFSLSMNSHCPICFKPRCGYCTYAPAG